MTLNVEFEKFSKKFENAEDIQLKTKEGTRMLTFTARGQDYTFNFDQILFYSVSH